MMNLNLFAAFDDRAKKTVTDWTIKKSGVLYNNSPVTFWHFNQLGQILFYKTFIISHLIFLD